MTQEILQDTEPRAEERLPWRKPEIRRLVINVDTQNQAGSGEDLGTYQFEIG